MAEIKVPPLGESIVEATVARWLKNEGDSVEAGDTLVELETDKITVEVPAMKAGRLTRQLRGEGDVVKLDEVIGEIDESAADDSGAKAPADAAPRQATAEDETRGDGSDKEKSAAASEASASEESDGGSEESGGDSEEGDGRQRLSPAAARIVRESDLDVSGVSGTGRGGVVTKPDLIEQLGSDAVKRASKEKPEERAPKSDAGSKEDATQAAAGGKRPGYGTGGSDGGERETREKMSTRRKRISDHLLEAQHSTAHLTTFNEIDMTAVLELRQRLKEKVEKEHEVRLSFMPFFIKAACMALKSYPMINAQVDGDHIIYRHYVNMGIAVASDQGLVVPNLRDAHAKGIVQLSREMNEVADRARNGKLTMDDLTGGTFTITNGGVFGSLVSTPIINFPQVGILGLHKIQDRPVAADGQVVIRPMMYVALSYDHRIVDGQQAVLFLVRIKELIEDPASMLVE